MGVIPTKPSFYSKVMQNLLRLETLSFKWYSCSLSFGLFSLHLMFAGKSFQQFKTTMTPPLSICYITSHISNFLVQLSLFLCFIFNPCERRRSNQSEMEEQILVSVFRSSALPGTKHSGAAQHLAETQLCVLWLHPYVVIFRLVTACLLQCHDDVVSEGSLSSIPTLTQWHYQEKKHF